MFAGSSEGVMLSDIEERDIERDSRFDFSKPGFLTYPSQIRGTKYWRMPQRFLGDKVGRRNMEGTTGAYAMSAHFQVTSYGGRMEIQLEYSGSGPMSREPMVVLKVSLQATITTIGKSSGPRKCCSCVGQPNRPRSPRPQPGAGSSTRQAKYYNHWDVRGECLLP